MLHFQVCSTCYTELQVKKSSRSVFAINPLTTDINMDDSHNNQLALKPPHVAMNHLTPSRQWRKKWDTKEDKGKSMMHALLQ